MKSKKNLAKTINISLVILVFALIGGGLYINIMKQRAIDRSRLPEKVELSKGFQRWITNLKNSGMTIEGDEFRLKKENEIYNTRWMTVSSLDDPKVNETFQQNIAAHQNIKKVIFSPSEKEYIDYRNEARNGVLPTEVHFYGQKEDKLVDARLLSCKAEFNCYFDRAYFLDNDVFVISEFSRNLNDNETNTCAINQTCTYTVKIHVVDLKNNSRLVYESKPFELNLQQQITQL
jgi:hypothetical protein